MRIEASVIDPLETLLTPRGDHALRVCLVVPQSGALGMVGPSAVDAALLASHELNVAGGARGRYVEVVLVDGGREPATVAREVDALCAAGAVDVVTGFHTSDVHRAVERVVSGRTPYVFTPPHEGGTRLPGVVCVGADPGRQLRASLRWLSEHYAVRRWALIGNDYIWPRAVHRTARPLVTGVHGEVVLERWIALGQATGATERLVADLRRSRAQAVLLSLVGRDLASFNSALRRSGLDGRLVRLCASLEENGLLACGGDTTGRLYAAMPSFASLQDDRRLGLNERHRALLGPQAPVLDTYAEGVYDGMHLVATLAAEDLLAPEGLGPATARLLAAEGRPAGEVHLARADGVDFAVVS